MRDQGKYKKHLRPPAYATILSSRRQCKQRQKRSRMETIDKANRRPLNVTQRTNNLF